jgi:hypothetical protein
MAADWARPPVVHVSSSSRTAGWSVIVFVVPEFVGELFTLDREGDRNDDLGESPAVPIASLAVRLTELED